MAIKYFARIRAGKGSFHAGEALTLAGGEVRQVSRDLAKSLKAAYSDTLEIFTGEEEDEKSDKKA